MPSKKRVPVHGYTIEEVKAALRSTPFLRDSSKKQYKTVNGKRFAVFCGCDAEKYKNGFEGITESFYQESCISISHDYCSKCLCWSYIDISSLNLPSH